MAYEQRDNSGSLFVNDRKESDKHPDRSGTAMIDGREYWVSGWVKTDKNGKPWMSMAFKPKGDVVKPTDGKMRPRKDELDDGDAIPF
jgi:hypothetical protein